MTSLQFISVNPPPPPQPLSHCLIRLVYPFSGLVQWFLCGLSASGPVILNQGAILLLRGHLTIPGDIFGCQDWWGTTGIYRIEVWGTDKHCTMHKLVPAKHYPAQKLNTSKAEKIAPVIPTSHLPSATTNDAKHNANQVISMLEILQWPHLSLFPSPLFPKATRETNAGRPGPHNSLCLSVSSIHSLACQFYSDIPMRLKGNKMLSRLLEALVSHEAWRKVSTQFS